MKSKKQRMQLGMAVVVLFCMTLILGGCSMKLGDEHTGEVNVLQDVVLAVDEESVKTTEITYTIDNQSQKDLTYGRDYYLEMEKDGKWYQVIPKQEIAITLDLLWVPAGMTESIFVNWADSYGELKAGHYRIIKPVTDNKQGYFLAGEFTVLDE